MTQELPSDDPTNESAGEIVPQFETITEYDSTKHRSKEGSIHGEVHSDQETSNTSQISVQQPTNSTNSLHSEQLPQHSDDRTSHGEELMDQNEQSAPTSDSSSHEYYREFEDEYIRIKNQIDGYERLSPRVEGERLEKIRDKLLYLWGASLEDVELIRINKDGIRSMKFELENDTIVNLGFPTKPGTKEETEAILAKPSICRAWPRDHNVEGVTQFIVESDGSVPATTIPWEPVQQAYKHELSNLHAPHDMNLWFEQHKKHNQIKYNGYEDTWHRWCFDIAGRLRIRRRAGIPDFLDLPGGKCRGKIVYCNSSGYQKGLEIFPIAVLAATLSNDDPFSRLPDPPEHKPVQLGLSASFFSADFKGACKFSFGYYLEKRIICWQIRYFQPVRSFRTPGHDINCLLSERQTATIRQGPEEVRVQERRVRITFQVPSRCPNLFHILVLVDDEGFSKFGRDDWNLRAVARESWSRYGLEAGEKIIPVTHLLMEICKVFEKVMDAWEETLDSIDELVHVNLSDFDDQNRVEDLMFDKSFNRSKEYFVALQLLRIVDEWIEEVIGSIGELQDNRVFQASVLYSTELKKNLNAADKYIKERAGALRKRVQKKTEEINSLRDGLFNATSLRESTKAMALNQAIYVFTVVTVLFTPVSFLATFWALPFLNNPREGSDIVPEPSAFRNSFIVMPLLTYALVVGIAWHVGRENPNGTLLRLVRTTWEELRQFPRSLWELRPRLPERKKTKSSDV